MTVRVVAIDRLRGLIMALMALDHTRDFFFGLTPDPTDLATTTPALFATRWITHICAPGFLLLAGVSARLYGRSRSRRNLASFLALRGALLVILELTIISFAWIPDPGRSLILLQVIWAIGWSMMLLAVLVWLPVTVVGAMGLIVILGHPMLADAFAAFGGQHRMTVILFQGAATLSAAGRTYIVSYPILPWAGVMAFGYAAGGLFLAGGSTWRRASLILGAAFLVAFLALRTAGLGDPEQWMRGGSAVESIMAYVNAEKYPPSPVYLTMTLGPVFLLLAAFGGSADNRALGWLDALGRAPLFFYVVHLYVLHLAGLAAAAYVWGPGQLGPPPMPNTPELGLWAVWLIWLVALVVLTPPTVWFAGLKARRRFRFLGYL